MRALTDEEAQSKLNEGICPLDGTDVLQHDDYDDIDGVVFYRPFFQCEKGHHYCAERDREMREYYPLWEGAENA